MSEVPRSLLAANTQLLSFESIEIVSHRSRVSRETASREFSVPERVSRVSREKASRERLSSEKVSGCVCVGVGVCVRVCVSRQRGGSEREHRERLSRDYRESVCALVKCRGWCVVLRMCVFSKVILFFSIPLTDTVRARDRSREDCVSSAAMPSVPWLVLFAAGIFDSFVETSGVDCNETQMTDLYLFGHGSCVDQANLTVSLFGCTNLSHAQCLELADTGSCALACQADPGCTGFELRQMQLPVTPVQQLVHVQSQETVVSPSPAHPVPSPSPAHAPVPAPAPAPALACFIAVAQAPAKPRHHQTLAWKQVNGTQPDNGRVVAGTNADVDNCCYKRAYPRPNPSKNPVPTPPTQTEEQKMIFANQSALAAAASAAALPELTNLISFCAANASVPIFDAEHCPGMAYATANGTLAPYPTAEQLIERFAAAVRGAEYVHGFATLDKAEPSQRVFDPTYPFLMNLWTPCTLGLNTTPCFSAKPQDQIQREVFGCKHFTELPPLNFSEAVNRVTYTAMNFNRAPFGNTMQFGDFAAVLKPQLIRETALITPTDSGAANIPKQ